MQQRYTDALRFKHNSHEFHGREFLKLREELPYEEFKELYNEAVGKIAEAMIPLFMALPDHEVKQTMEEWNASDTKNLKEEFHPAYIAILEAQTMLDSYLYTGGMGI